MTPACACDGSGLSACPLHDVGAARGYVAGSRAAFLAMAEECERMANLSNACADGDARVPAIAFHQGSVAACDRLAAWARQKAGER